VQEEAALDLALFQVVYELLVVFRPQSRCDDGLCFAAGEKR
jgi:hypothetical protein